MTRKLSSVVQREREVQQHYNRHPVPHHVSSNTLLARMIDEGAIQPQFRVVDVGCGQGVIAGLIRDTTGAQVIGIDITPVAASITQGKGIPAVVGSNLALPLAGSCADVVISNGVIHHTPDPGSSFGELARTVKPGGCLYLSLYRQGTSYHAAYRCLGGTLRFLQKILGARLGNLILVVTVLPWFYLATCAAIAIFQHRLKLISWRSAWHSLNDQFLTPIATFHSEDQILLWAHRHGLECLRSEVNTGTGWMWSFWLRKAQSASTQDAAS